MREGSVNGSLSASSTVIADASGNGSAGSSSTLLPEASGSPNTSSLPKTANIAPGTLVDKDGNVHKVTYATSIYPYIADRRDEFDVAVYVIPKHMLTPVGRRLSSCRKPRGGGLSKRTHKALGRFCQILQSRHGFPLGVC